MTSASEMAENGKAESMVKRFSGETQEPQKDYKRWKRWSKAYLIVQRAKGVDESALGAMLFTLLDGAALRAFDSVEMDSLEQAGGQDIIYQVLDERFPEEAVHDRLGEVLDGIFDLKVDKNESTAAFTGKARAAFTAAEAEGVKLPSVAKGYLLLRFSRLPADKKAVVMAAARQSYEETDIAAALRTTYPDNLWTTSRVHHPVNVVDQVMEMPDDDEQAEEVQEVLAAFNEEDPQMEDASEPIEEQDAIDVLLSWKQTRTQISREKLARGLGSSQDLRKLEARVKCFKCQKVGHFSRNCPLRKSKGKGSSKGDATSSQSSRVSYVNMVKDVVDEGYVLVNDDMTEYDEVAAIVEGWAGRPKDHWTEEGTSVIRHHVVPRSSMFSPSRTGCPVPLSSLSPARLTVMTDMGGETEEQFTPNWKNSLETHRQSQYLWTGRTIFYKLENHQDIDEEDVPVENATILEQNDMEPGEVMILEETSDDEDESRTDEVACNLVHAAGYGVVDTGCGRGLVGEQTLLRHQQELEKFGRQVKELPAKMHTFRYGNGSADQTARRVELPAFVGGKELRVRLHVVPGSVPLLLSKRLLKGLGAKIDMTDNKMNLSKAGVSVDLLELKDGSYQINLLDKEQTKGVETQEVDVLKVADTPGHGLTPDEVHQIMMDQREAYPPDSDESDDGYPKLPQDASIGEQELDDDPGIPGVFKHQERKGIQQNMTEVLATHKAEALSVIELFSPRRFADLTELFGMVSRGSFDLSEGWDFNRREHRLQAEETVKCVDPDLLTMCPPCGPLSRMQNLTPDSQRVDLDQHRRDVEKAKMMVIWCLRGAERQIQQGRDYLFESSQTSGAWQLPEMKQFVAKHNPYMIDVSACAVGLRDPESKLLYGKKWRFLTGSRMIALALEKLRCDGRHVHQPVEGSSGGMMRTIRTQIYPQRLLKTILGAFAVQESVESNCMAISQATIQDTEKTLKGENRKKVEMAIRKLHINLGHASRDDMLRILKHHQAAPEVLELVKGFECSICQARVAPKAVKDSAPPRDMAPLRYIGLDVKQLPSWKKGEKIKALNICCRMSGLQQMYPFREQENSDLIARLYRLWTKSYGRPRYVKFDAGRCNLGQSFLDVLERDRTTALDVPGEAHEQMGDVESQGRHFEETLQRVIDEMSPSNYTEWIECVDVTCEARNSLLRRAGYSPYQLVFGRDPEFPGDDLAEEQPDPISNSAILEDAIAEYQHRARSVARQEVLRQLDHRAARVALNACPRPLREFRVGDEVAVWRRGKGIKKTTARWRGPGIVAGHASGNLWVSMPGSFIKCTPEQLRLRTTEEREADRFLVRDLRAAAANLFPEVGMVNKHQKCFYDISDQDVPPGDLLNLQPAQVPDCRPPETPPGSEQASTDPYQVPQGAGSDRSRSERGRGTQSISSESHQTLASQLSHLTSEQRVRWEESRAHADRLDGVIGDMVPRTPPEALEPEPKRLRATSSQQQIAGQMFPPTMPRPPAQSQIIHDSSSDSQPQGSGASTSSALFVRDSTQQATSMSEDSDECFVLIVDGRDEDAVLLAGGRREVNLKEPKWNQDQWKTRLEKGIAKEVATVISDKQALRPLSIEESRDIRRQQKDRIIPSRLVLVEKMEETGEPVVKARWTARGDKDPDLFTLVREGCTQAPTISSNGRYTVMQTIASMGFKLQLGDVTGAFLEADEMTRTTGQLFMSAPANHHLPGFHPEQLYEVIKPIYGLNDSPQRWFTKFADTVKNDGWIQSRLDHCVFFHRNSQGHLTGVLGVHVDDVLLGGKGASFEASIERLRAKFPFRKWKHGAGTFCGAELSQCPETNAINVSQEEFANKLEKPKLRNKESPLMQITPEEASSLKSVLGGALWLAKETRPDLAVQVSQGQQLLPSPTLGEARTVGNVVRRAKQYKNLSWKILPIPFHDLRVCLHTDAAFANAKKQGTQAGYLVGITTDEMQAGKPAPWSPCAWKSYRLKRVVGSTFAGESQVLTDGLGHAEWISCHLAEAKYSDFTLSKRDQFLSDFKLQAIVDCKSIYDHLQNYASPGSIGDKRVAIDLVIIRETLKRVGGLIRWVPTWLQLADAMTKESPEAMDLLRAALVSNRYHLSQESVMLDAAAKQRQVRLERKNQYSSTVSQSAQASPSETPVLWVSCPRSDMVKVPTEKITEEEIRSLFECMISEVVVDEKEYEEKIVQNKSMCKVRIPAHYVNTKTFRAEVALITFTYTKTTKMIQVQGSATLLDRAEETLRGVLAAYGKILHEGTVEPLPEGTQVWSRAVKKSIDQGSISGFIEGNKVTALGGPEAKFPQENAKQVMVPEDESFKAAVADLCNEGARKLFQYPAWRNKFLQFMLRDFNADTDQVLELSELTTEFEFGLQQQQWEDTWQVEENAVKTAVAKSRPVNGYRGA